MIINLEILASTLVIFIVGMCLGAELEKYCSTKTKGADENE